MKNKGGKNWRVDIIRAKYKHIIKKNVQNLNKIEDQLQN